MEEDDLVEPRSMSRAPDASEARRRRFTIGGFNLRAYRRTSASGGNGNSWLTGLRRRSAAFFATTASSGNDRGYASLAGDEQRGGDSGETATATWTTTTLARRTNPRGVLGAAAGGSADQGGFGGYPSMAGMRSMLAQKSAMHRARLARAKAAAETARRDSWRW